MYIVLLYSYALIPQVLMLINTYIHFSSSWRSTSCSLMESNLYMASEANNISC